jgi:CheY-like chemotaxis protein
VGRLAPALAHTYHDLLTVITGCGDLLRESFPSGATCELVGEIRQAAERAAALTRQLAPCAESRQAVADLNAVIGEVVGLLGRVLDEGGVELTTDLQQPAWVRANPGRLHQALLNLAGNARDAMPTGGRLLFRTRGGGESPYVVLEVRDTGCGMSPELLGQAFEPFFTSKGAGKGTGLGLAAVRDIVHESGGQVELYSEPGRGTTVRVSLPRAEEPRQAVEPSAEGPNPGGAETVLLVEDVQSVRWLAHRSLQKSGYHVLEAGDGAEALAVAERHGGPIHLLVTDVVMPAMGGRELAERLTALRPGMRVLFVSGYTDDVVILNGCHFLAKPFTQAALLRKIREVLDG